MNWNWDHLRFFLALAEEGTLALAARQLEVSHTTVLRRIRAFEKALDTHLFDHTPQGHVLTPAGNTLLAEAIKLKQSMDSITREIGGTESTIGGEVVITTTDTLAFSVIPALLAELSERYADLRFTLEMANRLNDIDNREADIAIRTGREPPAQLIGRRVGTVRFAACASRGYVAAHALHRFPRQTAGHRFIVLDRSYAALPISAWIDERISPDTSCTTVSGFLSAIATCRAGLGITVVPSYLLEDMPDLVELPVGDSELPGNDLWILSRADLRDTERVRIVRRYLYDALAKRFGQVSPRPASRSDAATR